MNQSTSSKNETSLKSDAKSNKMNGGSNYFGDTSVEGLKETVSQMSDTVKEATESAVSGSIEFFKKYPIHSLLGAAAVGYVLGMLTAPSSSGKKSASK